METTDPAAWPPQVKPHPPVDPWLPLPPLYPIVLHASPLRAHGPAGDSAPAPALLGLASSFPLYLQIPSSCDYLPEGLSAHLDSCGVPPSAPRTSPQPFSTGLSLACCIWPLSAMYAPHACRNQVPFAGPPTTGLTPGVKSELVLKTYFIKNELVSE